MPKEIQGTYEDQIAPVDWAVMRKCYLCHTIKRLDSANFATDQLRGGFMWACRSCIDERGDAYGAVWNE